MLPYSRFASLLILAAIAVVTLGPPGWRPDTGHTLLERAAAFTLLGLALGLGFPRRLALAVLLAVGSAVVLEALQLIDPGRHARLRDMAVKAAGGVAGVLVSWALVKLRGRAG